MDYFSFERSSSSRRNSPRTAKLNPQDQRVLEDLMRGLLTLRRRAPYVDTTTYVNWNAMMASAFLHAGAVLDRPECNDLALKLLERIWTEAWDAERGMRHVLGRAAEVPRGMLDDNVQCAAAFLDAWEATGRDDWRERAVAVMTYCATAHWAAHWGDPAGGYFDLAQGGDGMAYLAARAKPIQDAPTPSPNGVAALVLARLWAASNAAEWRTRLDRQLGAFAGAAADLADGLRRGSRSGDGREPERPGREGRCD